MKAIDEEDQKLRRNLKYKEGRSYLFSYKTNLLPNDKPLDTTLLNIGKEFREKNFVTMAKFINIVDSLGHVPSQNSIFGLVDISVLINHTSYYDFGIDLDSVYYQSVLDGHLSPKVYAWFEGYHTFYYGLESKYYYTTTEESLKELNLSDEETEQINKNRYSI